MNRNRLHATATLPGEMLPMNILRELFLTFAKIGTFTFGGGYAMISMIEHHCVEQKKWITHDEMMNIAVIAESTPGPIAINCATYTGYMVGGVSGALAATTGVVLPSFVIIYCISMFLDQFLTLPIIANAFGGIKIAVGILILNAAFTMLKKMKKGILSVSITILSSIIMLCVSFFAWNFSSITLMVIAAIVSLCMFLIRKNTARKGGDAQ